MVNQATDQIEFDGALYSYDFLRRAVASQKMLESKGLGRLGEAEQFLSGRTWASLGEACQHVDNIDLAHEIGCKYRHLRNQKVDGQFETKDGYIIWRSQIKCSQSMTCSVAIDKGDNGKALYGKEDHDGFQFRELTECAPVTVAPIETYVAKESDTVSQKSSRVYHAEAAVSVKKKKVRVWSTDDLRAELQRRKVLFQSVAEESLSPTDLAASDV